MPASIKYSEEQNRIAKSFEDRAFAHFNDPQKFDQVMEEFEQWKKQEGI